MPFLTFWIYETMEIKRFTSIILDSEKKTKKKNTQFLGNSWPFFLLMKYKVHWPHSQILPEMGIQTYIKLFAKSAHNSKKIIFGNCTRESKVQWLRAHVSNLKCLSSNLASLTHKFSLPWTTYLASLYMYCLICKSGITVIIYGHHDNIEGIRSINTKCLTYKKHV